MRLIPFIAIILYVVARLSGDYSRRLSDRKDYKAECDRAAMREASMHPWVSEEWHRHQRV
jgi:hypothetical protein